MQRLVDACRQAAPDQLGDEKQKEERHNASPPKNATTLHDSILLLGDGCRGARRAASIGGWGTMPRHVCASRRSSGLEHDGDAIVVLLGGELDLYNADDVRTVLVEAIDGGTSLIVIDLAEVEFVDSTALGVATRGTLAARRRGAPARRPTTRDSPGARGERSRQAPRGPRLGRPGARTLSDDHLQLRVLDALQGAERYNRWLAELTLPYLGDDPIEAGSGIGTNAALWLELGVPRVTVSELDDVALARLRERFAAEPRVQVEVIDLERAPRRAIRRSSPSTCSNTSTTTAARCAARPRSSAPADVSSWSSPRSRSPRAASTGRSVIIVGTRRRPWPRHSRRRVWRSRRLTT